MVDDLEPLTTETELPAELSLRRILVIMVIIILVGAAAAGLWKGSPYGIALAIGGMGSVANYYWQRRSTRDLFRAFAEGRKPAMVGLRYLLRYVAIGLFVAFFYFTGALPAAGVIAGLASFALAVVVEGLISIFSKR